MRDFKGMKRQRGRSRNSGGGSKPQHNSNRAFDSNGPEGVKVRGAAQTVYEKYQQLARDAHTAGDRVLAENHLQHAEHYFRVMRVMQPQRPLSEIIGRDQFVSGYDMDFEDESGAGDAPEGDGAVESAESAADRQDRGDWRRDESRQSDGRQSDGRQDAQRQDSQRQGDQRRPDRSRDERSRDDRRPYERNGSDRPYADRNGAGNERGFVEGRGRDDRSTPTGSQGRDDRPRFERQDRSEREPVTMRDPLSVVEPEATPLVGGPRDEAASSRGDAGHPPTPFLRADDGEVSHAPAFLQARPHGARSSEPRVSESGRADSPGLPAESAGETRRPRRRAAPRTYVEAPAIADSGPEES